MKKTTTLLMLGLSVAAMAQNMKKERITVSYLQPPTIHLEEGMGYTSSVILDYEAEINAELAKAEEEYPAFAGDSTITRFLAISFS